MSMERYTELNAKKEERKIFGWVEWFFISLIVMLICMYIFNLLGFSQAWGYLIGLIFFIVYFIKI